MGDVVVSDTVESFKKVDYDFVLRSLLNYHES